MPRGLMVVLWAVLSFASFAGAAPSSNRPNVLLIVTDDQRPDTIHALGNAAIRTPTLDRLCHEGTAFTRATCAYPVCVMSRAEILTGCTAFRAVSSFATGKLNESAPRWPEAMRAAGYQTWYVGKWHTTGKPTNRGYVASNGLFFGGGGKDQLSFPLDRSGQPVTGYAGWVFQDDQGRMFPERGVGLTPNISEAFADAAIELIERRANTEPFFLHVNFTAPHDPRFMPRGMENAYEAARLPLPANFAPAHPFDHGNAKGRDEKLFPRPLDPSVMREEWRVYFSLIEHLDAQVNRILGALERSGRLKDTIVMFTSDHGLAIGSHGLTGKQNLYEHSIGVPLIMKGPGIPANLRSTAQCYLRDLFPTVCHLCGIPKSKEIDGKSLKPVLDRAADSIHPFVVGYYQDSQRMIRGDRWKLIRYPRIGREQLFDLREDPGEMHDRIGDPMTAGAATGLRADLTKWLHDHGDRGGAGE